MSRTRFHDVGAAAGLAAAVAVAGLAVAGRLDAGGRPAGSPAARGATAAPAPLGFRELYRRAIGAVVRVDARRRPDQPPFGNGRRIATGTAWLADRRGTLVTNAHVVDGASSVSVRLRADGRRIPVRIVGRDPSTDLAVLRADPRRLGRAAPLPLAAAGTTAVGDPVLAIGTPFRLQGSASAGIVSALDRRITAPDGTPIAGAIQTDADVNPGNSGGPLLDERGRVVGVTSQGETGGQGRGSVGVNFAVSAGTVARILPELLRTGRVAHGFLGVATADGRPGARITDVTGGGPAARAGLRAGDVIVQLAGRPVRDGQDLAAQVTARRAGERVKVRVRRAGRSVVVGVRLGRRPA